MAKFDSIPVPLNIAQMREAIRTALPPVEVVARELHDVVFAMGKPIPAYDQLYPETREWFMARAQRLLDMFCGEAP